MPDVYRQLRQYVKLVGAKKLISSPTAEEKKAFDGILFIRGFANVSFILELAAN